MKQYHKMLEAFVHRTFILLLHRGMDIVRKGIADKGGNPKVRLQKNIGFHPCISCQVNREVTYSEVFPHGQELHIILWMSS